MEHNTEERTTSFKGTTFKVGIASIAALALIGIGALVYPDSGSSPLSSFTDLSYFRSSEYTRSTRKNTDSRDIKYLDRHAVSCTRGNYLNKFKVSGRVKYEYSCMRKNGLDDRGPIVRVTPYRRGGNDGPNYLDRVDVECRSNEVMGAFRMQTKGWFSRDFRYRYECYAPQVSRLACSNKETNWNNYESIWYLDRHNVDCPANQAIQQFKVSSHTFREHDGRGRRCRSRHWWGGCKSYSYYNKYKNVNKIRYNYKCCKIDTYDPTPVPVARPTHTPISRPTHRPIAEPTYKPSETPIAEPTFQPTINTKPLVCPVEDLKYGAKKYTTDLPAGCAIIALDDLGWEGHKSTKGVLICGSVNLNGEKFEKMNLVSGGAAKTISYLYAAPQMKITYYTEKQFKGSSDTFVHGDEPIVHHKIVGADANDAIKSLKLVSSYDGAVPSECPLGAVEV